MTELRTFDPVGAFQGARRNQQLISAEESAAPRRNQLQDLNIDQARQTQTQQGTKFDQQQALQRATIIGQSAQALGGLPLEQRDSAFAAIAPQLQAFGIDPAAFPPGSFTDENLQQAIAQSQAFVANPAEAGFTLSQGQQRFDAQGKPIAQVAPKPAAFQLKPGEQRFENGRVVATGAPIAAPVIPPVLLGGLSEELANKGSAAFAAAGGGDKGIKAFTAVVDKGSEQERRQASPQIIKTSFPNASPAETQQLQATMDAAKTTEAGLKAAEKVRVEQRRSKKAQVFQDKAVTLLQGILANPQLGDVLGSIEGAIDTRLFSDAEAELIADIQEAGNILTADNLSLMSGVLSETDIKILQNLSGGALNRLRSEDRFTSDVTELVTRLSAQKVTTIDDQQNGAIDAKKARLAELRAKAGQ